MAWSTTITVEINFRTDLTAADNWTDVTQYVLGSISIQRGRSSELERCNAGTCSFTLLNTDRRFDFNHSTGPYFGKLMPRTLMRVKDGANPLFQGYIQSWTQGFDYTSNMATVEIHAVDYFEILAQTVIAGGPAAMFHRLKQPTSWWRIVNELDPDVAVDYKGKNLRFSGSGISNDEHGEPVQKDATKVAYFDGFSSSRSPEAALTSTQNWSVGGWVRVRPKAYHPNGSVTTSLMDFGSSIRFRVEFASTDVNVPSRLRVFVQRFSPNLVVSLFGPVDFGDDKWHHIVVTNQANLLLLYVDGQAIYSETGFGTALVDSLTPTNLGGLPLSNFPPTVCWMHDVFAYNVTLSGSDITLLYEAATNWGGQSSGLRLARLISFAGITVSTYLPSGSARLDGVESFSGSLLEEMQNIADAEGGTLYVDPDGTVHFSERYAKLARTTVQATLGDNSSADIQYLEATPTLDTAFLFNQINTSRNGGPTFTIDDTVSQGKYGLRSLDRTSLPIVDDNDAVAGAQWLIGLYSTPKSRLPFVKFTARSSSTALTKARTLQLQDLVTVYRTPLNIGSAWSFSGHIEGINHEIDLSGRDWTVTLFITQFGIFSGYLQVGSATLHLDNGKLGW